MDAKEVKVHGLFIVVAVVGKMHILDVSDAEQWRNQMLSINHSQR